ncbi:MAG: PfkB family carbohydrate kinase [Candidatus Izemoplasmatales bacterium]
MDQKRKILAERLKPQHPERLKMVLGFDGFVDEIIHPVDKRLSPDSFTRIETIERFAARIAKASGLSTNIELVPVARKIGGNGPIMCNALARHGSSIAYVGALGEPVPHDVFRMPENVRLTTIADAGHTDALEFLDGKLLLGKMNSMKDVTYERLLDVVGEAELVRLLSEVDLFASVNWSMLPAMTDLWRKLLANILPKTPKKAARPLFFVDIADPEKREHGEIVEALDLLKEFRIRFRVALGLNKKEAYDVAGVLGLFPKDDLAKMGPSLRDVTEALYRRLGVDAVVVHPVDRSATVVDGVYAEAMGPFCAKPKLTTGAGDNFNAGYVLGLLLGLEPEQALLTGMATSGFYVRNAKSPDFAELVGFVEAWAADAV